MGGGWRALGTIAALSALGACTEPPVPPGPGGLEFEVCPEARQLPLTQQAFQGYAGWFFFDEDLREVDRMFEQADVIAEVNRALATQGVALVVTPIPSRGVVVPQFLYPDDPMQADFSPAEAQGNYDAFVRTLRESGVAVLDVLAVMRAFDAGGGQTFFKRDGHWTPEGSHVVAQETAKLVRQAAEDLPDAALALAREATPQAFKGTEITKWLYGSCGYTLPAEPLTTYTLKRTSPSTPLEEREVVLAGTSFSIPPFYVSSLDVALQTDVLNASIGGGGVFYPLETYLLGDVYQAHRPEVVVWEFPVSAAPLVSDQRRRLTASIYGSCSGDAAQFERTYPADRVSSIEVAGERMEASEHYLALTFSDLSVLSFGVTLRYQGGQAETLELHVPRLDAEVNRGRFFTTLAPGAGLLSGLELALPPHASGSLTVQGCLKP